jgi:phage gp45-like
MKFVDPRQSSDRIGGGVTRTVLSDVDDTQLLQEVSYNGFPGEQQQTVEHAHPYGFSSHPKKPSMVQGAMRYAVGFVSFLRGNRSHGVAFQVGDRRYRLYKMQEGEVALHDDQGQWIHLRRGGALLKVPNGNSVIVQVDVPAPAGQQPQMGQDSTKVPKQAASFTMTKDTITVNAPNVVVNASNMVVNSPNTTINAPSGAIINSPATQLGAPGGVPAAKLGTIDTGGYADIDNLAEQVTVT